MRILGALAGVLALTVPMVTQADPLGSNMTAAGSMPGVGQLDRSGSLGRHPIPDNRSVFRQSIPGHPSQWSGWARSHWRPNHDNGSWGYHPAWGGPYTVWGGPYVPYVWGGFAAPYLRYGDWGALEYPYSEWRGPTGGWGNP